MIKGYNNLRKSMIRVHTNLIKESLKLQLGFILI